MKRLALAISLFAVIICFGNSITVPQQTPFFSAKQPPVSGGGGSAATLIFSTIAYGTAGGCTTAPATNTTGSSLIVVPVRGYRLPYPLASSSPANPYWTNLANAGTGVGGSGAGCIIYWTNNPATSASQTFSADGGDTGSTAFSGVAALGFSGLTSYSGSISNFATALTIQGTSTLTAKTFVSVAVANNATTYSWTIDAGWTIIGQGTTSDGESFAVAYTNSASLITVNPTWDPHIAANEILATYTSGFQ